MDYGVIIRDDFQEVSGTKFANAKEFKEKMQPIKLMVSAIIACITILALSVIGFTTNIVIFVITVNILTIGIFFGVNFLINRHIKEVLSRQSNVPMNVINDIYTVLGNDHRKYRLTLQQMYQLHQDYQRIAT